jgi:hypothetical protein
LSVFLILCLKLRRHLYWADAARRCWPVLVVLSCVAVVITLTGIGADPRIAKIGGMRSHTIWEPLYYDLQKHPDWDAKYAAAHNHQTADAAPQAAVDAYRARHNLSGPMTDRDYERYLRTVYLNFVRHDPKYVLQLKYYDMVVLGTIYKDSLKIMIHKIRWRYALPALAIVALPLCYRYGAGDALRRTSAYLGVISLFFLLSAIPIWAFIIDVDLLADTVIMAMAACLAMIFWVIVVAEALLATCGAWGFVRPSPIPSE